MTINEENVPFVWEENRYNLRTITAPDVFVHFVDGKLHHVTPPVAPGHKGGPFEWQSTPSNETHEYLICIKDGYEVPFSDWSSRCRESSGGVVTGTLKEYKGLNGFIDIEYSVIDLTNSILLDPIIRVN